MDYNAELKIIFCDGIISNDENSLNIKKANSVILAFSAVKAPEYDILMSYERIKNLHLKDYRAIFDKVQLYLGEQSELPTDIRLEKLRKDEKDNGLYALYFQYGRYLLISSSSFEN